MTQSFGVFFQCYKNPFATFKALESLRKIYPHCTVVLVSDNGYNYANMALFFNCIYIHNTTHAKLIYGDLHSGSHVKHAHKLLKRIKTAFSLIPEDYILWMEDDVTFTKPITDTFKYAINGHCPNRLIDVWVHHLSKKYDVIKEGGDYRFSGHGGSVFNKHLVLHALSNQPVIDDVLKNWVQWEFPSELIADFFMSMVVRLSGYQIGPYHGHCDFLGYINPDMSVHHQYKVFYGQSLPNELSHMASDTVDSKLFHQLSFSCGSISDVQTSLQHIFEKFGADVSHLFCMCYEGSASVFCELQVHTKSPHDCHEIRDHIQIQGVIQDPHSLVHDTDNTYSLTLPNVCFYTRSNTLFKTTLRSYNYHTN